MTDTSSDATFVTAGSLCDFYSEVLRKQGFYEGDSDVTALWLAETDLRAVRDGKTEGTQPSIARASDAILEGAVDPRGQRVTLLETPTTLLVDGATGAGPATLAHATERAIEKAVSLGRSITYVQRAAVVPSPLPVLAILAEANLPATLMTSACDGAGFSLLRSTNEGRITSVSGTEDFWSDLESRSAATDAIGFESLSDQLIVLMRAAAAAQQIGHIATRVRPRGQSFVLVVEGTNSAADASGLPIGPGEPEELGSVTDILALGVDFSGAKMRAGSDADLIDSEAPQHWNWPSDWRPAIERLAKRHRVPPPFRQRSSS